MGAKPAPVEERFWRFVSPEPNSGCWLWTGALCSMGYGQIRHLKRAVYATHISLLIDGRPRPSAEMCAMHKCDNPICVNPDHLRWGTRKENQQDMQAKGRTYFSGLAAGHAAMRAKKLARPDRACEQCGKLHKPSAWQERHNRHFFCSVVCSVAWQKATYTGKPIASWRAVA